MTQTIVGDNVKTAVECVFRDFYGQEVAMLVRIVADITLAQDEVSDALVSHS